MVRLTTITTKTGDDGTTGLADGTRRPKYDLRIQAIGAVDEANAALGVARTHTADTDDSLLARVQNDLFDLGADLASPEGTKNPLRITPAQVLWLEGEQSRMLGLLEPLESFILPGGNPASAALHLARTIVRRAERAISELNAREPVNPAALHYINRLSDFLFVLGRFLNDQGINEHLWQPAGSRKTE